MTITLTKTRLAIGLVAAVLVAATAAWAADHPFNDVPRVGDADERFFSEPVQWAWDNGLTTGSPSGSNTFKPLDSVTRGENITFNFRYDENVVQPALESLGDDIDGLQSDKIGHGEIVLNHGTSDVFENGASVGDFAAGNPISGSGWAQISLHGPSMIDGVEYGLQSIRSCTGTPTGDLVVSYMETFEMGNTSNLDRDTTADGDNCFDLEVNHSGATGYDLVIRVDSTSGSVRWNGAQSTWVPVDQLGALGALGADDADGPSGAAGG